MGKKQLFGSLLAGLLASSFLASTPVFAGENTRAKSTKTRETVARTDYRMPRHTEQLVDVTGSHIPQRITPYGFSGAFLPVDTVPFNQTVRSRDTSVGAVLSRLPYISSGGVFGR